MTTRTVTTRTVEQELVELETQYWQALKDQDVEAALRLTDDECIVSGPQGFARLPKAALEQMMRSPSHTLNSFSIGNDAEARVLTSDVAILAYNVHEELTVDGKQVSLDAADASTWVRRSGRWLCALHTESILGDPYGRPRRADQ